MKSKISLFAIVAMLALPGVSSAQVGTSLDVKGSFTTGTDTQFTVLMTDYQGTNNLISILTLADANITDIKSASFQDKSGWVKLTPYQSGSDIIAKFISDTGFDGANGRSITLRLNFNVGKTYIVGFSLQDLNGRVVSSAAAPLTVTGPRVLGETVTPVVSPVTNPVVSGSFNRTLTYGSSGSDVMALQQKLTAEGFYSGPITGFYGRLTQTAVKKYQSAHYITPNGVVGPATLTALNQ